MCWESTGPGELNATLDGHVRTRPILLRPHPSAYGVPTGSRAGGHHFRPREASLPTAPRNPPVLSSIGPRRLLVPTGPVLLDTLAHPRRAIQTATTLFPAQKRSLADGRVGGWYVHAYLGGAKQERCKRVGGGYVTGALLTTTLPTGAERCDWAQPCNDLRTQHLGVSEQFSLVVFM